MTDRFVTAGAVLAMMGMVMISNKSLVDRQVSARNLTTCQSLCHNPGILNLPHPTTKVPHPSNARKHRGSLINPSTIKTYSLLSVWYLNNTTNLSCLCTRVPSKVLQVPKHTRGLNLCSILAWQFASVPLYSLAKGQAIRIRCESSLRICCACCC